MDSEIQVWLLDIKTCIDEIFEFLDDRKDFFSFKADIKTKKAVQRNFEIIGEAMNRILRVQPDFPVEHAKKIIGMRNRIIHSYDAISDELIWTTIIRDLPLLKQQIDQLVKNIE